METLATRVAEVGSHQRAGEFLVAMAVEKAEGLWHVRDGQLEWHEPSEDNAHLEVAVLDGTDRRFVPGLTVHVTARASDGTEIGTYELPFLWHPWVYHYGKNVKLPGDGTYTFEVHIALPAFPRHDRKNGCRYTEPVAATFEHTIHVGQG